MSARVTRHWLGSRKAIPSLHLHQRWRGGRGKGGLVNPILRDLLRLLAAVRPLLLGLFESGMAAAAAQAQYAGGHGAMQDRVTQYLCEGSRCTFPQRYLRRGKFPPCRNIA